MTRVRTATEKTLITHARTRAARFLGYDIITQTGGPVRKGRRATSGVIGLRVPGMSIKIKCGPLSQTRTTRTPLRVDQFDDHTIVATYGAEYRGIVQYYLLAGDVSTATGSKGSSDLDAEDPGRQASLDGDEDGP